MHATEFVGIRKQLTNVVCMKAENEERKQYLRINV